MACKQCDKKTYFAEDLYTAALLIHFGFKVVEIQRSKVGVSLGFRETDDLWELIETDRLTQKLRVKPSKFWESVDFAKELMYR
ncbi:MAG: hypothetical protein HGB37_02255 [Candidatus Moranbacteria bacterium]|nr:hypothetical protein [Candidatus Moranbacteria bacterium]